MKKFLIALMALSTAILAKEVTVSIVPQKFFVEKIAGDKVNVNVMVKPGFSPATYEPKTSQMKKLSKSDIYFSIDVPFENVWLEKFKNANKKMLIIDTAEGIKKIKMAAHTHHHEEHHDDEKEAKEDSHEHHDHAHKHDEHDHHHHHHSHKHDEHHDKHDHAHKHDNHDHHHHDGLDPHVWLDPMIVKIQAKNIYDGLVKIDSKNKDFYLNNYKKFVAELEELNKELTKILKPYSDKAFMVFHPAWGYFAKRYDLEQISVEVEGKEPKPAQLIELIEEAKEHKIKIVFVSPQFSQKGAKTIAESIKGKTAIMNPLSSDWDKNLLKVAKEIANTYK